MIGLAVAAAAHVLVAGLSALAVLVLVLAARSGHWPLWLLGYAIAALALALALVAGEPR